MNHHVGLSLVIWTKWFQSFLNKFPSHHLTFEWQRKPNTTMVSAGVRMIPNTTAASAVFTAAMMTFCAVTRTEHAQQSSEALSSRGSAEALDDEYGGGTTAAVVTGSTTGDGTELAGCRRVDSESSASEPNCWDGVLSSVPLRDKLILNHKWKWTNNTVIYKNCSN